MSATNVAHAGIDTEGSQALLRETAQAPDPHGAGRILRDAFLSALVALGIFTPLVGLLTQEGVGSLHLVWRPLPVAVLVALVFVGRLAILGWHALRRERSTRAPAGLAPRRLGRLVAPALLAVAITLPLWTGRYYVDLGTLILTYVMLGWGLNIVVGLAGLLDLGYVAFYAVGAYTMALLSTDFGFGFWICLPLSGVLAAFAGVLLGFPVLRLRGDYLAIVTLGFGEIIRLVITNWVALTNGPNGILGIPHPTLFGLRFSGFSNAPGTFAGFFHVHPSPVQQVIYLYYIILAMALVTNLVTLRLRRMPLGRAWEALREDEIACRSLGINVTNTKLTAFATGALFGGFAGAFFATRQSFVSPESFTFIESAIVLAIVVLGGLGSQLGVALAAIVMIGGGELVREFAAYRMLIFGLALVLIMVLRPRGLVSGRRATVALGQRRQIGAELVAEGRG